MKWMDDGIRDILRLPSDEREKLKRLDETIQGKKKWWWLHWWGLLLLGVGIGARWINPLFAVPVYVTIICLRLAIRMLQGCSEAMANEYDSLQRENEELKASRTNQRDEKEMELAASVAHDGREAQRIEPIGFGRKL